MTTLVSRAAPRPSEAAGLHYELHRGEEIGVLRLEGALKGATVGEFAARVPEIAQSDGASLVVDASLLWEIDASGLAALIDLHSRVTAAGGRVNVYAATGPVARALDNSPLRP